MKKTISTFLVKKQTNKHTNKNILAIFMEFRVELCKNDFVFIGL